MKTAVVALIIASLSLVVAIIGSIITVKNYRKSKRLEFFQRRDQLFQRISELNAMNSAAHLVSARFEILQSNRQSLLLTGNRLEENKDMIARIQKVRDTTDETIRIWDENISDLHRTCSGLKETDAPRIEELLVMVQTATDNLKNYSEISRASLHTMETLEPKTIASVTELQQLELQELALETASKKLDSSY